MERWAIGFVILIIALFFFGKWYKTWYREKTKERERFIKKFIADPRLKALIENEIEKKRRGR